MLTNRNPFSDGVAPVEDCSPGSHPHSDRPNWRPAEDFETYMENCREGLEAYSDRRVAKFLGLSRVHLYRIRLMAELPEGLFEHIITEAPKRNLKPSSKAFAQIALALRGENRSAETQCCPNCGH